MTEERTLTPSQAAEFLHVSTTTLKKYAILLEDQGHIIQRNSLNHRHYVGDDLARMKAMLILNRLRSVTLEEAASIVTSLDTNIAEILQLDKDNEVQITLPEAAVADATPSREAVLAKRLANVAGDLQQVMAKVDYQQQKQDNFIDEVSDILLQQAAIIQQQNTLITTLLEQQKKPWWQKIRK